MYLLSVLAILVAISMVPTILSDPLNQPIGDFTIPSWIKNTAGWWADDKIPDSVFIQGIQFLIKEEIITVQIPAVDSVVEEIPGWVKNTAGWWAEDKIQDITFVAAVRYLVSQGIVYVEREQVEEPVEEVEEITDFYMEVNGSNCCLNWGYVGEEYRFQIETFDEKRGSPIDGVTITAKIISKGGELRYDFGQVTTEDGFYKNSITIPSLDWYAGNILSVTGTYNGVEKTIEKEFEVFYKKSKRPTCQHISCYTFTSVSNANDGSTFAELDGPREIALFTIGSSTYVIVAGQDDDGFEIIDISTPSSPTSAGSCADGASCDATHLKDITNVAVATIGGTLYAVTVSYEQNNSAKGAISIFDISTLSSPTQEDVIVNASGVILFHPYGLALAEFGGKTYAVVAAGGNNGISVIDISTPSSMTYKGDITDGGTRELKGAHSVAIATIGGTTYAVVTAINDAGIAIIDISTDPTSPSYVGEMEDDANKELGSPNGVAIATIDGKTYAVVVGDDDGIAIIDISTPGSPTYVSEIEDDADKELDYGRDVEVATINGRTYAFVAAYEDDALAVIDITDPTNPSYVNEMEDDADKVLDGAKGVVITTIDGVTYAVVTAYDDDGIEIIRILG